MRDLLTQEKRDAMRVMTNYLLFFGRLVWGESLVNN